MQPAKDDISAILSSLPYTYDVSDYAAEIKKDYTKSEGKAVSIAGRVVAIRRSGKLIFMDVLDSTGKIQCYFDYARLAGVFDSLKAINSGDIIGVKGKVFKTNPGEISVNVEKFELLSKALRPLPSEWYGLKDPELRYRKRYLDLILNSESRKVFIMRSKILKYIREFLDTRGFIEFETPTIQPLYGGGDAEPFETFISTLNEKGYLRISDELYLKRLIIGGFDKVYEICKDFRNEDLDSEHSPEFTMIEWYQAYADYNDMMNLTEEMLGSIAKSVLGSNALSYQGRTILLASPFKKIKYVDSINEKVGLDVLSISDKELFSLVESKGLKLEKGKRHRAHAYDKLFSSLVQPELVQPTFVMDYPRETSPLTRPKRGNPKLVERFELYIGGLEIANSYSELNNPLIQRENFEMEAKKITEGDKEAEPMDLDFLEAMEYGMPPTGGLGMGIDRLVMLFTGKNSIKEVILFPMEKKENKGKKGGQLSA
ncbi:MAG: lysine--tRNA ligase [Candidatus Micrarchaeaceae archaeon]